MIALLLAAAATFCVPVKAQAHDEPETIKAKSGLPEGLMLARTPEALNPIGSFI